MKDKELTLTIDIFEEYGNTIAWIRTENDTGAEYYVKNEEDVGNAVKEYLKTIC